MQKILITTAIDYTNDVIHIGHAYQKIAADCLARFYRLTLGREKVFFLTGTDEHGANIEESAKKVSKNPKDFVDGIVEKDKKEWESLNIKPDRFIRTTDPDHKKTVAEFWTKSLKNNDIDKGTFYGKYCLGCESYKTESEIIDNKCPLHQTKELQNISEKNYFFKWSKYEKFLEELLGRFSVRLPFVLPAQREHEMQSFLAFPGVKDIPISRSKEKLSWGIPVPNDEAQVIYVWFDALINYYTAAAPRGFWDDRTHILHIIGKDNLRWHALLWPAMLKSAGLRLPDQIYAHSFINLNGQKISKSLGNVIRPSELISKFGTDAVRYFFLKYGPSADDVDISIEQIEKIYNSELANDWGNVIQRISALCQKANFDNKKLPPDRFSTNISLCLGLIDLSRAFDEIFKRIAHLNNQINQKEPWKKTGEELKEFLTEAVNQIQQIAFDFQPFMPETSAKILKQFRRNVGIKAEKPYFPRIV